MEVKQTALEWFIEQLEGDDSTIARVIGLKKYKSELFIRCPLRPNESINISVSRSNNALFISSL